PLGGRDVRAPRSHSPLGGAHALGDAAAEEAPHYGARESKRADDRRSIGARDRALGAATCASTCTNSPVGPAQETFLSRHLTTVIGVNESAQHHRLMHGAERTWTRAGVGCAILLAGLVACSSGGEGRGAGGGGGGKAKGSGAGAQDDGNPLLDLDGVTEHVSEPPVCSPEPFPLTYTCEGTPGPWAEALQKALWFFNVNKSGPGVHCTDVQWRGDAHVGDGVIALDPDDPNGVNLSQAFIDEHRAVLDPDGDGTVDLAGGYHDAGDYIKFTLTTAFAASMIAWSVYEYPDRSEERRVGKERRPRRAPAPGRQD